MERILMNTESVVDVVKTAEQYRNMALIMNFLLCGVAAIFIICIAKSIISHIKGDSVNVLVIIGLFLMLAVSFTGNIISKRKACEEYKVLVNDYEYTCWYEGKEVDINTLSLDKYIVEIDEAGKMLKLTKPVYRRTGYIPR